MYEKPVVIQNDELAEGVYMDSGNDCWAVQYASVQPWDGAAHVFEIHAQHKAGYQHISSNAAYVITFSDVITAARSDVTACAFAGNVVTVNRALLADGYTSGDVVTFKVWVSAADEARTQALNILSINWVCTHAVNVQGGMD